MKTFKGRSTLLYAEWLMDRNFFTYGITVKHPIVCWCSLWQRDQEHGMDEKIQEYGALSVGKTLLKSGSIHSDNSFCLVISISIAAF